MGVYAQMKFLTREQLEKNGYEFIRFNGETVAYKTDSDYLMTYIKNGEEFIPLANRDIIVAGGLESALEEIERLLKDEGGMVQD